ncbi:MAG: T9SS type A sorting domain-containing protein [Bacteroides sp.]|nr:T9SS type A sorting domain-containing protein [Bacteroides sp.]MCM1389110.1 T9SS type A sorting domain-containing protein [Bacteroides sp.]
MKKFLLAVAALAAMSSVSAQETYNYFDAADVDANGWLWFDTQEKIDKYVGFQGMGENPKIMLVTAQWEDKDGQYAEPECNPNAIGYNAAGEQGGEGAKKGAIILPMDDPSKSTIIAEDPKGGSIMLWLPDCAEFDLFVSTSNDKIIPALWGARGHEINLDCFVIQSYGNVPFFKIYPLADVSQFQWNNIQDLANGNTGLTIGGRQKVTALVLNGMDVPLYIHGIKVMTYTKTSNGSAGIDDVLGGSALSLSFNGNVVNATEAADMSVYSIAGAKVAEAHGTTFALDNLAPGAYVVKAVSANGTATIKVVR